MRTSLVLAATFSGARDEFGGTRACIGVGSGRAFAGVVGASGDGLNRREFTTMGDCVNVAARMMGLASKPGATRQVLMDEDTLTLTLSRIRIPNPESRIPNPNP